MISPNEKRVKRIQPIELTECEGYYENKAEALINELKRRGLYQSDLLYRGIAEDQVGRVQSMGTDRVMENSPGRASVIGIKDQSEAIFAGDEQLLRNESSADCPLKYGYAVVVYRRADFEVIDYQGRIDQSEKPNTSCCTYRFKNPQNKRAALVAIFLV